jgi:hypothetical protein
MGKTNERRRKFEIRKKLTRKVKLQAFAKKFSVAKSLTEKKKINQKMEKLAPHLDVEAYMKSAKK